MSATLLAVLDDPGLLGARYPRWFDGPAGPVAVRRGSPDDLADSTPGAVILDTRHEPDVRAVLGSGVPALVSVAALATADQGNPGDPASAPGWLPYLPTRDSVDVWAGAALLARGTIGAPLACQLTTYVGRVAADPRWEQDAPFARSTVEALVFGLDLIESLVGSAVIETTWSTLPGEGTSLGLARHNAAIPATQWVAPARLGTTPLFAATVLAEQGRLLLRHEFAPGAVTVWDARARAFRSPALERDKHNVQAPDTAPGGAEAAAALLALLERPDGSAEARRHTLRLVRHALTALPAAEDPVKGVPA